jgi:thioredoxin reductase (NADPH)
MSTTMTSSVIGPTKTPMTRWLESSNSSLPLYSQGSETSRGTATPVILAVDGDSSALRLLVDALTRRYGADYQIITATSPTAGLDILVRLGNRGTEVALVIATLWLPGMTGVDFLAHVHQIQLGAKRAVLTTVGDRAAAPLLHRAMALGELDLAVSTPWCSPEEQLYPRVSETLAAWWRTYRPRLELVRVVGEQWARRSHELRDLGTRNGVPFGFYPVESEAGQALLGQHGLDPSRLPVIFLFDGQVLVDPSNAELAEALGVATHADRGTYDLTIVGAGPAGLATAVYAVSEGLRTVVIEPEALGGQAGTSSMIRNYLGFPRGIGGEELTSRAYEQALDFGAEFVYACKATGLRAEGSHRIITLSDGSEVMSRAVVLATGVSYRRLGIPSLERLVGAGVFYGAANAEARALQGEDVLVVGAGNSAGQAALHLADHAARVTMVVRGDSLAKSMSSYLIHQIEAAPNIEVRLQTRVIDGRGGHRLERLVLEDLASGRTDEVAAAALFLLIGAEPRTEWLDHVVARDEGGYILTCRDLAPRYESFRSHWPLTTRSPFPMETSVPGVFAIGDVRHNAVKRVASAVGGGAIVTFSVHEYLASTASAVAA